MDTISQRSISSTSILPEPQSKIETGTTFTSKKVSATNKLADHDHKLTTRSTSEKIADGLYSTLSELMRFNISQVPINAYHAYTTPEDPLKAACKQADEAHMQDLYDGDYKQFTSHSTHDYMSKTNEHRFGDNPPLIHADIQQLFTEIIRSVILGDLSRPANTAHEFKDEIGKILHRESLIIDDKAKGALMLSDLNKTRS
ncbi:hypothetical protein [Endozoicomonas atrinae]|uniref:hypothetical protein n=1 Tax=Endozoicomonas atrinae TaxID=1333660 RepID=UPI003B00122E